MRKKAGAGAGFWGGVQGGLSTDFSCFDSTLRSIDGRFGAFACLMSKILLLNVADFVADFVVGFGWGGWGVGEAVGGVVAGQDSLNLTDRKSVV